MQLKKHRQWQCVTATTESEVDLQTKARHATMMNVAKPWSAVFSMKWKFFLSSGGSLSMYALIPAGVAPCTTCSSARLLYASCLAAVGHSIITIKLETQPGRPPDLTEVAKLNVYHNNTLLPRLGENLTPFCFINLEASIREAFVPMPTLICNSKDATM
jgi:hypothetical protein